MSGRLQWSSLSTVADSTHRDILLAFFPYFYPITTHCFSTWSLWPVVCMSNNTIVLIIAWQLKAQAQTEDTHAHAWKQMLTHKNTHTLTHKVSIHIIILYLSQHQQIDFGVYVTESIIPPNWKKKIGLAAWHKHPHRQHMQVCVCACLCVCCRSYHTDTHTHTQLHYSCP